MRKITGLLAAGVLFLAACGDDDDDAADNAAATATAEDDTATATGVQNDAAEELIKQADDGNLDPDEGCIREKAANLSDEDAQKIVDAGSSSDTPELSAAGLAIVAETMSCVSTDEMMNQVIEGLPENVDADCVRDKLEDIDFGAIFESGSLPPEVDQAVSDCGTG